MGAEIYVYDRSIDRLRELEVLLNGRCSTCFASTLEIERGCPRWTSSSAPCSSTAPRRRT